VSPASSSSLPIWSLCIWLSVAQTSLTCVRAPPEIDQLLVLVGLATVARCELLLELLNEGNRRLELHLGAPSPRGLLAHQGPRRPASVTRSTSAGTAAALLLAISTAASDWRAPARAAQRMQATSCLDVVTVSSNLEL